jgi:protein SCO1/2
MQKTEARIQWLFWGMLTFVVAGVFAAFAVSKFYGGKPLPNIRHLPGFVLTNQFGEEVTLSDLRGKVWVSDIIFTRCPGPCAKMTKQLAALQADLPEDVMIVTLTADPEYDTPAVLKQYAEKYGADTNKWVFLSGPKKDIYELALDGLLLAVQEKESAERTSIEDMFIHSTTFVIVDKRGNLRAYHESLEPDANRRVLADIKNLLREK